MAICILINSAQIASAGLASLAKTKGEIEIAELVPKRKLGISPLAKTGGEGASQRQGSVIAPNESKWQKPNDKGV